MRWLDRLVRLWQPLTIPNIAVYIIGGQFLIYAASLAKPEIWGLIICVPQLVLQGQVWRLFTFVFTPPGSHPIFLFIAWYMFYYMASALEERWGATRFNLFLIIGWLVTVSTSFVTPWEPVSTVFLAGSVFLAFAHLYPTVEFLIFFILPIQVRWLALLTWIIYGLSFLGGTWSTRLTILASVSNFLLFFGRDIYLYARREKFKLQTQSREMRETHEVRHRCASCGITDKSHPDMDFRYCSRCFEPTCYCANHIRDHECLEAPVAAQ